jgi:hypothetical protein
MPRLQLERSVVVNRPVEIVRSHFLDFEHHIRADVHRSISYTLLGSQGDQRKVRQQFKVLGLPKSDEILVAPTAEGDVLQTFEKGEFAGGTLLFRFTPLPEGGTRITARLDVPLRGINVLMAPLLPKIVGGLVEGGLEEDRLDLQTYNPGG